MSSFRLSFFSPKLFPNNSNKQWLWLAIDIETKEIVGFYLGERGEKGAA